MCVRARNQQGTFLGTVLPIIWLVSKIILGVLVNIEVAHMESARDRDYLATM